jgi:hypothetical protein
MEIVFVFALIAVLEFASLRFGTDSRESGDWHRLESVGGQS